MKLYELTQNYMNLQELLEDPEIPQEMIVAALNEVTEEIEEKAENIAKLIKSMELDAAAIKEEEARLASKRKSLEGRVKNLKEYLEGTMRAVDKKKIKGKLFSFNIQKNPASLDIYDTTMIPKDYIKVVETFDNAEIKKALKEGKEVPGAILMQSESLRIR